MLHCVCAGIFNRTCSITYTAYRNVFPLWALAAYTNGYRYRLDRPATTLPPATPPPQAGSTTKRAGRVHTGATGIESKEEEEEGAFGTLASTPLSTAGSSKRRVRPHSPASYRK